jgi:hypothetical protein
VTIVWFLSLLCLCSILHLLISIWWILELLGWNQIDHSEWAF